MPSKRAKRGRDLESSDSEENYVANNADLKATCKKKNLLRSPSPPATAKKRALGGSPKKKYPGGSLIPAQNLKVFSSLISEGNPAVDWIGAFMKPSSRLASRGLQVGYLKKEAMALTKLLTVYQQGWSSDIPTTSVDAPAPSSLQCPVALVTVLCRKISLFIYHKGENEIIDLKKGWDLKKSAEKWDFALLGTLGRADLFGRILAERMRIAANYNDGLTALTVPIVGGKYCLRDRDLVDLIGEESGAKSFNYAIHCFCRQLVEMEQIDVLFHLVAKFRVDRLDELVRNAVALVNVSMVRILMLFGDADEVKTEEFLKRQVALICRDPYIKDDVAARKLVQFFAEDCGCNANSLLNPQYDFLHRSINPWSKEYDSETPLEITARAWKPDLGRWLILEKGVSLPTPHVFKWFLHHAGKEGNLQEVKYWLLEIGGTEQKNWCCSQEGLEIAFFAALGSDRLDILNYLFHDFSETFPHGSKFLIPNHQNRFGQEIPIYQVANDKYDSVLWLATNGVPIPLLKEVFLTISRSIRHGHWRDTFKLVEAFENLRGNEAENQEALTSLILLVLQYSEPAAVRSQQWNRWTTTTTDDSNDTLATFQSSKRQVLDLLKLFRRKGASFEPFRNVDYGGSPLFEAVAGIPDLDLVELLLQFRGESIRSITKRESIQTGRDPSLSPPRSIFHFALFNKKEELLRLFLRPEYNTGGPRTWLGETTEEDPLADSETKKLQQPFDLRTVVEGDKFLFPDQVKRQQMLSWLQEKKFL